MLGVYLPLAVGELHDLVARDLHTDDGAVREDALLRAVGEEVLDGLVWECDLIGAIWVVLLCLLTVGHRHTHTRDRVTWPTLRNRRLFLQYNL